MRFALLRRLGLGLLIPLLAGSVLARGVAVKRGETSISPRRLPLVCLGIETIDAALPLDTVELENLTTHKKIKAVVSSSFNSSHPDLLTALAGGNRSLSLPILSLPPGSYVVTRLEFVGGAVIDGYSMVTFDLAPDHRFRFEVQPGRVNYVGSIVIAANWSEAGPISLPTNSIRAVSETKQFGSNIRLDDSVARDRKWSTDVVPGLTRLPWVSSPMQELPAPATPATGASAAPAATR